MRPRGRITLAAGLAAALVWGVLPERSGIVDSAGVAAVSAPPPERRTPSRTAPEELLRRLPPGARGASVGSFVDEAVGRVVESVPVAGAQGEEPDFFRVNYTVDAELSGRVERILRRGRVALGHVLVMEVETGRILTYESTDPAQFPATRAYPMASIMKVVTAAGLLRRHPEAARDRCRYIGSPYRLTRARLTPPRRGHTATLERALATSNNQCFARIAVHELGAEAVNAEARRAGLLRAPALGHDPGSLEDTADDLDLGRLGSGLDGSWVTPLGALRLAAALAKGMLVEPHWVDSIEAKTGERMRLPEPVPPAQIWTPAVTDRLRAMLTQTTRSGTARRAFRNRRGRPLLGPVRVSGKTGSLNGREPKGRYEWFVGVAPAEDPQFAIAALVVNGDLWWRSSAQIAADVLKSIYCKGGVCSVEAGADLLERGKVKKPEPDELIGAAGSDSRDDKAG